MESSYLIKELQPKDSNFHAVYLTTPLETFTYHYERKPADPRIGHEVILKLNSFGNVTDRVLLGYPRRIPMFPEQSRKSFIPTRTL